jgi:ubiquinone/menaquinone biosynthesis C-methylase UbiE
MASLVEQKREFWDDRAKLGDTAGSNDFMLKKVETDFILRHLPRGGRVLDIGCGNGDTLIKAHKDLGVTGMGLDFSSQMIAVAQQSAKNYKDLSFQSADVRSLPKDIGQFDAVYVQRCLINLNSLEEQKKAFESIMSLVKPGGIFIMVECTIDGQNETNALRDQLGIEKMEIPWHNLFFYRTDVESWQTKDYYVEHFDHISSTYHFLSRVVYAYLGEAGGGELKYDSEINKLALLLPPNIGEFGPVKGWIWRKK